MRHAIFVSRRVVRKRSMSRPQSKYVRVDPKDPFAAGECSRCGRWFQQRELQWQFAWGGSKLFNTGLLVCTTGDCLDIPNEQLRSLVLPPDPLPILNARVPNYAYEEQTVRIVEYNSPDNPPWGAGPQLIRCLEDGETTRILQYIPYPPGVVAPPNPPPASLVPPWPPL